MTNPQQTLSSMVKSESICPKVRNKTRVPTFTITIQHSFGHNNQSRKRNKRNPNCQRSKTLIVCRRHDSLHQFSLVQSLVVSDSLWPHESQHARSPCPSPTPGVHSNSCPSSQWCPLILCHPLLLLPPTPPSIRVFSNESTFRMRWPKSWSFSFSIIPSKEIPGLISFRMD